MLGRKTVEAEILKDALEIAQTKKVHIAHALITTRRYPTQQIALTLGVSRSNLYRRLKQPDAILHSRYHKADDLIYYPSFGRSAISVQVMAIGVLPHILTAI